MDTVRGLRSQPPFLITIPWRWGCRPVGITCTPPYRYSMPKKATVDTVADPHQLSVPKDFNDSRVLLAQGMAWIPAWVQ